MKKTKKITVLLIVFAFIATVFSVNTSAEMVYVKHRVEKGDTLSKIAAKYLDDSRMWEEILKYNNIKDPNFIYTGDVLVIPSKEVLRKIKDAKDEDKESVINESKANSNQPKFDFRKKMEEADSNFGGFSDNTGMDYSSSDSDFSKGSSIERKKVETLKLKEIKPRLQFEAIGENYKRVYRGTGTPITVE